MAEAKERRQLSAPVRRRSARRFDDCRGFDESAEILLMQAPAGERRQLKLSGVSSKITGRCFILARSGRMAVARMRLRSRKAARAGTLARAGRLSFFGE
ncbi:hypothetical protein B1812_08855 [Methylocystis bryophila]|uniref:Uncharacterized protein n=1 Tax=Methylocystis bryophila TaxID=655015 RepID=A0A1W6MU93_9HYPH|nr:hypothetical protein B1812_08855 [Methylocystis bryophila]